MFSMFSSIAFPDVAKDALDLLAALLVYNSSKRLTAAQVVQHSFIMNGKHPLTVPVPPPRQRTVHKEEDFDDRTLRARYDSLRL
jgi:hypothetical protein